ncbi:MAG: hypothetical protein V3Q69_08040 [Burkholderia sp.]
MPVDAIASSHSIYATTPRTREVRHAVDYVDSNGDLPWRARFFPIAGMRQAASLRTSRAWLVHSFCEQACGYPASELAKSLI